MDLIISKGPSIIECELLKIMKLKNRTINGPYNSRKLKKGYKKNVGPYTKVYPNIETTFQFSSCPTSICDKK